MESIADLVEPASGMSSAFGVIGLIIGLFIIILFILWIVLPFLIVGTNNRLNRLIALTHESNGIQEEIRDEIKRLAGEAERSLNQ